MALIGAINGIAPASAPVIGGITVDTMGWKGVFVILAAMALLILFFSPGLKESLTPAMKFKGSWLDSIKGYGALLRNRNFMIHVCYKGVALGMLFAYISASPFILQTHYGLSPTVYGLIIGFNAIFVASGSMVALKFHPLKKAARLGAWLLLGGVAAQAISLYTIHSLWVFEATMVVMLFALGLIFSTTNTLAMNEGRMQAGEASSVLGVSGYITGAIVAPLVGIGNILHSTAITYVVLAIIIFICSTLSYSLAPDLDK